MEIETIPYVETEESTPLGGSFWQVCRRLIFGSPLRTTRSRRALIPKILALPVFCSDAISSVAYGNQQIPLALGAAGLWHTLLHGHTGLVLKLAMLNRTDVVVTDVRYNPGEPPPVEAGKQAPAG